MSKLNTLDDELDKISVDIYEETKNMSQKEFWQYFRQYAEKAAKKYGFTIMESLNTKDNDQTRNK
jgi:ABC-type sugar transport system substrate-binding protein